jgi:chromosome segregation ATPase
VRKQIQRQLKNLTSKAAILVLATLLLIAIPVRTVSAQGLPESVSVASELKRLKTALSSALDRIEDDTEKINKAEAYIKTLEAENKASGDVVSGLKDELLALYRRRQTSEEEASKLRSAVANLEKENGLLRETVAEQDRVIIKQNEKISTAKKVGKIAFIVGIGIGIVAGIKIGGRR